MKKIVVAFDSFKGSVSAGEAGEAARRGLAGVLPGCEIVNLPIADGGEGTAEAIARVAKGVTDRIECDTLDPLMRPMAASYFVLADGVTAVVELAAASGLPLVEPALRNPLHTSTFGTGILIRDALDRGCRKFVIGLGGSATNDGGMGMLAALGFKFVDVGGHELRPVGESLSQVAAVVRDHADSRLAGCSFVAACDVTNPLTGRMGAARIFAPQKGADHGAVEYLDKGLETYAAAIEHCCGRDISALPGAGAAGGVGGGIAALLDAELKPGSEIILDMANFDAEIADADLIITGEGRVDSQTGMGKAVGAVLRRAHRVGVPVVGLAGSIDTGAVDCDGGFAALFSIQQSPMPLECALNKETTLRNMYFAARQVAKLIGVVVNAKS